MTAELKQGNDLLTSLTNRETNAADELESLEQARESYILRGYVVLHVEQTS